jgi:hypothetical protein
LVEKEHELSNFTQTPSSRRRNGFGSIVLQLAAAQECAVATRHGRRPSVSALRILGIDEKAFNHLPY